MAPGYEEPMFKSSLTMLDHSPVALRADESRQAQASYSLIATGTGSAARLMPGSDTNSCLRSRTNFRREPSGPRRVRPFTDSAYSPDSLVHCPLTSWTTLRALSWTAKKTAARGLPSLHSWVIVITQIRCKGRHRNGCPLSRHAPGPYRVVMVARILSYDGLLA